MLLSIVWLVLLKDYGSLIANQVRKWGNKNLSLLLKFKIIKRKPEISYKMEKNMFLIYTNVIKLLCST